jgi:hypothetical protein
LPVLIVALLALSTLVIGVQASGRKILWTSEYKDHAETEALGVDARSVPSQRTLQEGFCSNLEITFGSVKRTSAKVQFNLMLHLVYQLNFIDLNRAIGAMDSVSDFESGGCGFESRIAYYFFQF